LLLACQGRAGIARHSRERLAVAGRGGAGGWLRAVCAGGLRLGRIGQGLKAGEAVLDIPFMACSLMKNPDIRAGRRLYVIFIPCNMYVSFIVYLFVKFVNRHFLQAILAFSFFATAFVEFDFKEKRRRT